MPLTHHKYRSKLDQDQYPHLLELLDAIPFYVFLLDGNGTVLPAPISKTRDELLIKESDYYGKNIDDVLSPEVALLIQSCIEKVLTTKAPLIFEFCLRPSSCKWIETRMVFVNPNEVITFSSDISERKANESKLEESQLLFRSQFDHGNIAIAILNEDFVFSLINQSFSELTGYSSADNLTWNQVVTPESLEFDKHVFYKLKNNELSSYKGEKRIVNKFGQPIHTHYTIVMFENKFLNSVKFIVSFIDISEKKNFEKKMLSSIIETEERERVRIARDIHDGLGPILSSVKMYVQLLQKSDSKSNKEELFKDTEILINQAHQTLKEISFNLSPHMLQNYGLVAATEAFALKIIEHKKINIAIASNNAVNRLEEEIEIILYRSITECINNTLKYGEASKITINFINTNDTYTVEYTDNGIGFNLEETLSHNNGMGLFNMQNRFKSINGKIRFETKNGAGFKASMIIFKEKK